MQASHWVMIGIVSMFLLFVTVFALTSAPGKRTRQVMAHVFFAVLALIVGGAVFPDMPAFNALNTAIVAWLGAPGYGLLWVLLHMS